MSSKHSWTDGPLDADAMADALAEATDEPGDQLDEVAASIAAVLAEDFDVAQTPAAPEPPEALESGEAAELVDPDEPVELVDPDESAELVDPDEPVELVDPDEPAEPSGPGEPAERPEPVGRSDEVAAARVDQVAVRKLGGFNFLSVVQWATLPRDERARLLKRNLVTFLHQGEEVPLRPALLWFQDLARQGESAVDDRRRRH